MGEVRDRLRALDQIQAPPDLRERIRGWEPRPPRHEPSFRRAGIAVLALVVATSGIALAIRAFRATEPPVRPATTIENGKIAFVSDGINLMNPEGTGIEKIREADTHDFDTRPVWSPDGTRIAFLHKAAGRFELLVFDVASGNVTNVAGREFDVDSPQWSPDGTRIAFVSGNGLFLINADGTGATRLTTGAFPTWSPDGSRIAFESRTGISVVNVDGSGEANLVRAGSFPAWSPSGAKIAFIDAGLQVSVVNTDGTGLTQLTDIPNDDSGPPAWSPDGSRIAFEALRDRNYDIYLVNADGTGFTNLTGEPGDENVPTWSPDGTKIAFIAGQAVSENPGNTGTFDVYVMNADGTTQTRLTKEAAPAYVLSWQPLLTDEEQTPTPTETPVIPSPTAVSAEVAGRIRLEGVPGSVAAAEGSVWVATYNYDRNQAAVVRIDAATNEVVASVPVEGTPSNLAAGAGAVWVPTGSQPSVALLRIDAATNEMTGRAEGIHGPIAVDPTGVWAIEDGPDERDSALVRIDPESLQIEVRVPVGESPFDMVAGAGSIWFVARDQELVRIDATSGELMATIPIDSWGIWIAADDAGVWVPAWDPDDQHNSRAYFVDASTNAVSGEPGDVYNFRPFAVADGRVWFISGPHDRGLPDGGVCGLNVTTRTVDVCAEPESAPHLELAHDPAAFDLATNSIWLGTFDQPRVTRIDVVPAQ